MARGVVMGYSGGFNDAAGKHFRSKAEYRNWADENGYTIRWDYEQPKGSEAWRYCKRHDLMHTGECQRCR